MGYRKVKFVFVLLLVLGTAFLLFEYFEQDDNESIVHDLMQNPEPGFNTVTVENSEGEVLNDAEIYIDGDLEAETNSSGMADVFVPGSHYFTFRIEHGEKIYEQVKFGFTGTLFLDGPQTWVTEGEELEYVVREDILHNHSFGRTEADIWVNNEYRGETDSVTVEAPEDTERVLIKAVKDDFYETTIDVDVLPPVELDIVAPYTNQSVEENRLTRVEFEVEGLTDDSRYYRIDGGSGQIEGEIEENQTRIVEHLAASSDQIDVAVGDRIREVEKTVNVDLDEPVEDYPVDESNLEVLWPDRDAEFADFRSNKAFRVEDSDYSYYAILINGDVKMSGEIPEDGYINENMVHQEGGNKEWRIGLIGDEAVYSESREFYVHPAKEFFGIEKNGPEGEELSYDEVELEVEVQTPELSEIEVVVEDHHGKEFHRFMQRPRNERTYNFFPDLFFREHEYKWYVVLKFEDKEMVQTQPETFQITERRPSDPGGCTDEEERLGLC